MKVRSNYVSNSSSTSFCIVGIIAKSDEFDVDSKNLRAPLVEAGYEEESVNAMDALEVIDSLYNNFYGNKCKMFLGDISIHYGLDNYSPDDAIVGLDIYGMRDDETLGQFKDRVYSQLQGIGFTGKRESISIHVDGGYDG